LPNYSEFSEPELTSLFGDGDEAAFKEIYERFSQLLYLYALKRLDNKEEAMDVVHDVFASLLSRRADFKLSTTLSGFLYKSVLNKVFDIYRHKDVIKQYIDAGNYYIDVDSAETDFLIREKDIAAMIDREIALMPPRMREVYELKALGGLSVKEIALRLGISEHTVATQLKRAMKHLKAGLGVLIFMLFVLRS